MKNCSVIIEEEEDLETFAKKESWSVLN